MLKNYNEEKNVICDICSEEIELSNTIICDRQVICEQCVIDSGGDYYDDDRDPHYDTSKDIALDAPF